MPMPSSRGSPGREILAFGTALALALPTVAHAEPSALPNWGAEAAAAKPAAKPAPAPAPAAAPSPAPASDAGDDVVMVDDPPAAAPRRARRASSSGGKSRAKPRARGARASLERAAAERRPIQDHAKSLENAGQLADAVKSMSLGAEAYDDPVLHLAAADLNLKLAESRGRAGVPEDEQALVHVRKARQLLANASAEAPRVDPEEHATLGAWADELTGAANRHKAAMGVKKNGHGQIIAGSVLGAIGLAGLGVMSGGLYLKNVSDRELEKGAGRPDEDLAPLRDQEKRGETMIAAGAVAGAIGLSIGIALVTIGARDLKASRSEPNQARLRVAPTIGGIVLAGRF